MAGPRSARASRPRISYEESSVSASDADEDFVDAGRPSPQPAAASSRSSKRRRFSSPAPIQHSLASTTLPHRTKRVKSRPSYAEHSSESDVEEPQDDSRSTSRRTRTQASAQPPPSSSRPRRQDKRAPQRRSYVELSSESETDGEETLVNVDRRKVQETIPAAPSPQRRGRPRRRPKIGSSNKGSKAKDAPTNRIESDGVIPHWTSLPYEILLSIFRYAIYPLHEEISGGLRPTANVDWAVQAARVCRAFTEPALTALYECPPIHFIAQPFGLLDLLNSPSPQTIDYRSKIKRLQLDSRQTLAYAMPHRGVFRLADLLRELPQLQGVDIVSHINMPPYFSHNKRGVWSYSPDIVPAMSDAGIKLKSWRWCGEKINSSEVQSVLDDLADQPCLLSVRDLTLSHLLFTEDRTPPNLPAKLPPTILPNALESLSELRSLTIETCDVLSWDMLNHLPNKLHHLSVINCPDFSPETLNNFLTENGRELRSLVINHNNLIDLSFLPDLKATCPRLEVLKMDHSFYSSAMMFKSADAEPKYETLLLPGAVPTWPSTLQEIELLSLRKFLPDAAAALFQSLIGSANEMPYLRHLTVRAMLDISWRDRAGFRDRYIGRLDKVFLDKSGPPNPHLASYKAYRERKQAEKQADVEAEAKPKTRTSDRRTKRAATEQDESSEEEELPIQGRCAQVDINIDNMRPTEHQFREDDFVDSELSGDEDWTGVNEGSSTAVRYAW